MLEITFYIYEYYLVHVRLCTCYMYNVLHNLDTYLELLLWVFHMYNNHPYYFWCFKLIKWIKISNSHPSQKIISKKRIFYHSFLLLGLVLKIAPQHGHLELWTVRKIQHNVHLFCPVLYREPLGILFPLKSSQYPLQQYPINDHHLQMYHDNRDI